MPARLGWPLWTAYIAVFALTYADQTRKDHAALANAKGEEQPADRNAAQFNRAQMRVTPSTTRCKHVWSEDSRTDYFSELPTPIRRRLMT